MLAIVMSMFVSSYNMYKQVVVLADVVREGTDFHPSFKEYLKQEGFKDVPVYFITDDNVSCKERTAKAFYKQKTIYIYEDCSISRY